MPIFDYARIEWERAENGKNERNLIFGGLIPKNEFYRQMKIQKSQVGFTCILCRKNRVKGTRYIGGVYDKICYNCVFEWINNSNKTLSEIRGIMEKMKEEIKENKEKWDKEVIVNSLE